MIIIVIEINFLKMGKYMNVGKDKFVPKKENFKHEHDLKVYTFKQ